MTHAWPARFGGRCNECGRAFKVGTMVRWEGGHIVEDECDLGVPEDGAAMGPKERVMFRGAMCMRCFTVHAPGQETCE